MVYLLPIKMGMKALVNKNNYILSNSLLIQFKIFIIFIVLLKFREVDT